MKYKHTIVLLFFLIFNTCFSQISLLSWNLKNFGKSKTDEQISFIATILNQHDLIAIQEVVSSSAGSQAVAKLADALNRKGNQWDYVVSSPTNSTGKRSERYAYFWKKSKLKLKKQPFLESTYKNEIEREPFLATFSYNSKEFTIVNFHALPKKSNPETEIKYFKFFKETYNNILFFVGDFNLPQTHTVFNPIKKQGFSPIYENQKTTLKQECKQQECLANSLDHIFYNSTKVSVHKTGAILFYENFESMQEARKLSDHIPIYLQFNLN